MGFHVNSGGNERLQGEGDHRGVDGGAKGKGGPRDGKLKKNYTNSKTEKLYDLAATLPC